MIDLRVVNPAVVRSPFLVLGTMLSAMLLVACEASRPAQVDPAGIRAESRFQPDPDQAVDLGAAPKVEGAGYLRVEADTHEVRPGWTGGGESDPLVYDVRDSYDVYDERGAFVKHVVNYDSFHDLLPVTVALAPGRYFLATPDVRWPRRWIEVTIAADRLTRGDARTPRTSGS
jgi:hypothetical protein